MTPAYERLSVTATRVKLGDDTVLFKCYRNKDLVFEKELNARQCALLIEKMFPLVRDAT